jgi:starch-binding outer membrane protein, SusD/RagB family
MNEMKNKSFLGIVLICLLSLACSDSFLDVAVQGGVTTTTDPKLAEKLVTGVYNSLLQGDSWGDGDIHGFAFITVTNIISDDADKGSTPSDQAVPVGDIDNFTLTPTNKFAETLWSGNYNGIGAANQALAALATAAIDADQRDVWMGEVRFLRAYLYFNLVRMYGGVPLVFRVPKDADDANSDITFKTRASVETVYDSIENDLHFAIEKLPLKNNGHVTQGAAKSMLAKVYMYQKEWDKVFQLTNEVINSGQYKLVEDYATIWRQVGNNSIESIFEIETGEFNNANLKIDNYTVSQGPRTGGSGGWDDLGWGFNTPSTSLVNAYEEGDFRKEATIISIDNSGTRKGTVLWDGFRIPSSDSVQNLYYNYKAYTSRESESYAVSADKDRPKNIKILRYAEVLLMNAEAALQPTVNQPSFAESSMKLIRERAGLEPKASYTIEDVWKERRVELAMEHDRFWDLVRQGRAAAVMHAAGKTNFVEGKHELLPIPNSQILLSGNVLAQNPLY